LGIFSISESISDDPVERENQRRRILQQLAQADVVEATLAARIDELKQGVEEMGAKLGNRVCVFNSSSSYPFVHFSESEVGNSLAKSWTKVFGTSRDGGRFGLLSLWHAK
jgi:hypothetical protein